MGGGDWMAARREAELAAAAKAAPAPAPVPAPAPAPPSSGKTTAARPSAAPSTATSTSTATATSTASGPPEYTPPEKPTPIDEVAYSQTAVSGLPELGAPPDIPAPSQRTVDPQELVEYRMSQMMQQDNPYMAQAITLAKQQANKSGLLNTTMAASAGVDAAMRNILPIAQQDAATLFTQGMENQKAVNEFLMQDYLTKTNFQLNEFGARVTTYNQALQQAYERNEKAVVRWWEATQRNLDREFDVWKTQFSTESNLASQAIGLEHTTGENAKACSRNAAASHAATIQKIEADYGTGNYSAEWRAHQIKVAENNYRNMLASCG